MLFADDNRVVMTLDAGGTNFVFSAIQGNQEIVKPVTLPSHADDLNSCLKTIIQGFEQIKTACPRAPVAISFAFPGPADYKNGIIGDLPNLSAFRGGVALGPMLENQFKLPVFINNDGNLFGLGESMAGFLPYVNDLLGKTQKRYKNLIGVTLGTGFGGSIICDGKMLIGDNSCSGEIWLLRNKKYSDSFIEESVSIRAIKRGYALHSGMNIDETPEPKDIYAIARGKKAGNKAAALAAFGEFAEMTGDALANVATLVDGLVVIGGGLAGAADLFLPLVVKEMNKPMERLDDGTVPRLETRCYNLEDSEQRQKFIQVSPKTIAIPGSGKRLQYDPHQRIGVGLSRLGTSRAIAIGAYSFALTTLNGCG